MAKQVLCRGSYCTLDLCTQTADATNSQPAFTQILEDQQHIDQLISYHGERTEVRRTLDLWAWVGGTSWG